MSGISQVSRARLLGYTRVSTDEQVSSGLGLEAQETSLRRYADLYDVELLGVWVEEGASAKSLKGRPVLASILEKLSQGEADGLLVAKLDRLTRSVKDLDYMLNTYFFEKGALLVSVNEHIDTRTAMGRFILYFMTSTSQWERETIGERTRAALAQKRARGERLGSIPFGQKATSSGKLVDDPAELVVIRRVQELASKGLSLLKIRAELEAEGHKNRKGKAFGKTQIFAMLRRKV